MFRSNKRKIINQSSSVEFTEQIVTLANQIPTEELDTTEVLLGPALEKALEKFLIEDTNDQPKQIKLDNVLFFENGKSYKSLDLEKSEGYLIILLDMLKTIPYKISHSQLCIDNQYIELIKKDEILTKKLRYQESNQVIFPHLSRKLSIDEWEFTLRVINPQHKLEISNLEYYCSTNRATTLNKRAETRGSEKKYFKFKNGKTIIAYKDMKEVIRYRMIDLIKQPDAGFEEFWNESKKLLSMLNPVQQISSQDNSEIYLDQSQYQETLCPSSPSMSPKKKKQLRSTNLSILSAENSSKSIEETLENEILFTNIDLPTDIVHQIIIPTDDNLEQNNETPIESSTSISMNVPDPLFTSTVETSNATLCSPQFLQNLPFFQNQLNTLVNTQKNTEVKKVFEEFTKTSSKNVDNVTLNRKS